MNEWVLSSNSSCFTGSSPCACCGVEWVVTDYEPGLANAHATGNVATKCGSNILHYSRHTGVTLALRQRDRRGSANFNVGLSDEVDRPPELLLRFLQYLDTQAKSLERLLDAGG